MWSLFSQGLHSSLVLEKEYLPNMPQVSLSLMIMYYNLFLIIFVLGYLFVLIGGW